MLVTLRNPASRNLVQADAVLGLALLVPSAFVAMFAVLYVLVVPADREYPVRGTAAAAAVSALAGLAVTAAWLAALGHTPSGALILRALIAAPAVALLRVVTERQGRATALAGLALAALVGFFLY